MTETDPSPVEFLADPLSPIARSERRNLLLAAAAGILVAKVGLIPTQLSALGISLTVTNQSAFVIVVIFTVIYFLGAFFFYGLADFLIWRKKYQDYLEQVERYNQNWTEGNQEAYDELRKSVPDIAWVYRHARSLVFARLVFEFILPIAVGLYAAISLGLLVCCP